MEFLPSTMLGVGHGDREPPRLPANLYGKELMNIHNSWEHVPVESKPSEGNFARLPSPRSFLDAGGELAAALSGSLHRCLGDMELGQILEVISRDPDSRCDVRAWCLITGHELLQVAEQGHETLFWIRKR